MPEGTVPDFGAVRPPQQKRSRASHKRMLQAARRLLISKGEDFTLAEVAKRGKVSIGSIYCRFDSKGDLLAEVQHLALTEVLGVQLTMIAEAAEAASSLGDLVARLVDGMAETLREHAPILRPVMLRAAHDKATSEQGKAAHLAVTRALDDALLERRREVRHADAERAVAAATWIMYSGISRYLGFGAVEGPQEEREWRQLKRDLAHMCSAFLLTSPERQAAASGRS